MLPSTPDHERVFREFADAVREGGGASTVFDATTSANEDAEIEAGFRRDREREYQELDSRVGGFLLEIEKETRLEKFTFAELEEIEDDFEKLSSWLSKIVARDFFPTARKAEAEAKLKACDLARNTFCERVYEREAFLSDEAPHRDGPRAVTNNKDE